MDSIDYYNRYAVPYYEKTVELSMEEQLQRFLEYLPENADVLDLGCGSGRDTVFLEEEGCVVTAMDGSEQMCKLASIHTGREVLHLKVEDMEFDDVFHGIWACAVLGHFPPEEIQGVMKKILRALKEDGILYFSVRKGDRNGRFNGRYFYDYDREALNHLLDSLSGIKVLDIWKTSDLREGQSSRWYNVLIRKASEEEEEW